MEISTDSFYLGGIPSERWNHFSNYFNHQAELHANDVYIRYYTEENGKPSYSSFTYSQVNHIATNLACEWHTKIQPDKPVAVLFDHSSDLLISMLAIFKLKVPLLALSPRNSKPAVSNLLRTTQCGLLISSEKYKKTGEEASRNVKGCSFLSLPDSCQKDLVQQPLNSRASSILNRDIDDQELNKIGLILHSSGTTGFPKPVYITNRALLNYPIPHQKMIESGKPSTHSADIFFAGAPLFHCFGFSAFFTLLYNGSSMVFPKQLPSSQQDIEYALSVNKCTTMATSPITLNEIVKSYTSKQASYISNLRCILTGGAPISKEVGNWFHSNGIKICISYGLSEALCCMTNEWDTTKEFTGDIHPYMLDSNGESFCRFETVDQNDPNVKHLCIRKDQPILAQVKLRTDEYFESGDLFEESRENPGHYKYIGRKDDTIIMSNGEKTNPIPMEQILNMSPVIKLAIVFGRGRECTSVFVLPDTSITKEMSEKEVMKHIEKAIKEVNDVCPAHSAIVPQMVKILPSDTVIPSTPKGTFMRKKVEEMFDEELDKLYSSFLGDEQRYKKRKKITTSTVNKQQVIQFLRQGAAEILNLHIDQIEIEKNLFDLGLDSLKSIQLRNYISVQFNVDNNFIFHHSSISSMYDGIMSENKDLVEKSYDSTQSISKRYLHKAEKEFNISGSPINRSETDKVVLLTGTTGSLGAFILAQLLKDPKVRKVYCVIRGDPSKLWLRLEKSVLNRALDISILNKGRIEVISLDFMHTTFGLDKTRYTKLKEEVNMVQHCGWLLDFNMPVEHFDKECIAPFYNLLKFSLQRADPIPIHFISSVSASARLDPIYIQEVPLPLDSRVSLPMGYAQSKFIVEVLLDMLAKKKNLPCYVHRVGQMYGDTKNGIWNYSEQFPLMFVGGGLLMGKMPILDTIVDWLPVDYAAATIVEIMSETHAGKVQQHIYHIVNPQPLKWIDILNIFKSSGVEFTTVPLSEWINMLANSPKNPATALISYYESMLEKSGQMPIWETKKTRKIASVMNHIPTLNSDLFKKFLEHWKSS